MQKINRGENMQPIDGTTGMTILAIGLYVSTIILDVEAALKSMAAIAAILAGVSTFAFNMYRFYKEYKENKKE